MVRLKQDPELNAIEMNQLKDGQIAIIVENGYQDYKGRIVQRFGNVAISLGMEYGRHWTDIDCNTLKVRVLTAGETLIIE
jgi:hypothetical protein